MTKPESTLGAPIFDVAAVAREMRGEEAYLRQGRTARTLVREADLRIVLLVMKAETRVPEHRADETASIQAISGHVRLHLPERVVELHAGQLLALDRGVRHDVEAVLDSAFLLTLGWQGDATGSPPG